MNGYLQRLAQSAAKPGGNIRPILEPVFSGLKPRDGADASSLGENFAETAAAVPAGEPPSGPARDDSTARGHVAYPADPRLLPEVEPETAARGNFPGDVARPRVAERPAGAESDPGPGAPDSLDSPDFLVALSDTADGWGRASVREREGRIPPDEAEAKEIPFSREGRDDGARPALPVKTFAPVVQGTFTAPAAAGPHRDSRAPAGEPDEINIHIGRIEVTAVQPPAPVAAVPRARRSASSLDDYLRQRDRRNP